MLKTYGVVLIGCGHIGESHIKEIYYRENIRIIGIVDFIEERAKLFAKKYGAQAWSTDYHDFLDNDEVDIVIIASYTRYHLSTLIDCLQHNKHVLCEKPIASNLSDGMKFAEAVEKYKKSKVLVGLILRHNDTYKYAAEMIKSGMIGNVRVMRLVQNHHTIDWKRYVDLLSDCSPIIDCGVHYFDVMQWFTGAKITSISGVSSVTEKDVPEGSYNYGIVTMRLSNGAVAYYEAGWGNTISSQNTKEFIGDRGRIKIILSAGRLTDREEGDLIEYYNSETKEYKAINLRSKYKNTYEQLSCLIKMIEQDCEGTPALSDVLSSFKVACAADYVLRTNSTCDLDENQQLIINNDVKIGYQLNFN